MYRAKKKTSHLFVHLNLCIALALGVLVFIAGIESATNNEACDTIMATFTTNFVYIINKYLGWLQICSSTVAVFVHICFLLDVV